MQAFSTESIETIADLASHSINHKLIEALKSGTRMNLNQKIPANVVALQVFRKYDLVTTSSDLLLNVPVALTEHGKLAATMGIDAYLASKGDSIRNYAESFVQEQTKAAT